MSRGLGKIEMILRRAIAAPWLFHKRGHVVISSGKLVDLCFGTHRGSWQPTHSQRASVARAMHSFVRKFPQYALMGGQGRKQLYLYDTEDPKSIDHIK